MFLRTPYPLIYFMLLGVLCAIAMHPTIVIILVFATFGFAIVLVHVHTLMAYSLALLPAFEWLGSRRRWVVLVAALLPAIVLAIAPGLFAIFRAAAYAATESKDDVASSTASRPRILEIIHDIRRAGSSGSADEHVTCDDICQRLLFNGEIQKLRVTRLLPQNRIVTTTFWIEKLDWCPRIFAPTVAKEFDPVRQRIATGTCLIAKDTETTPADATATITTEYPADAGRVGGFFFKPSMVRRLLIEQASTAIGPLRRQTQVEVRRLSIPYRIVLQTGRDVWVGEPIAVRINDVLNPFDLADALRQTFGFELSAIPALVQIDNRSLALRALARPTDDTAVFPAEELSFMNAVLVELAKKDALTEPDIDLVRRMIADTRAIDLWGMRLVLRRFPELAQTSLLTILERLALRAPERQGGYHQSLALAAGRVPGDTLRPHSALIYRILDEQRTVHVAGLLRRAGELDGDPTTLIADRLQLKPDKIREAAAIAACRLGPPRGLALKRILLDILSERRKTETREKTNSTDEQVVLALTRLGARDEALQVIATFYPRSLAGVEKALGDRTQGFPMDDCDPRLFGRELDQR